MRAYGQKLVTFCTHTHAAQLVVEMSLQYTNHTTYSNAYMVKPCERPNGLDMALCKNVSFYL